MSSMMAVFFQLPFLRFKVLQELATLAMGTLFLLKHPDLLVPESHIIRWVVGRVVRPSSQVNCLSADLGKVWPDRGQCGLRIRWLFRFVGNAG